MLSLELSRQVYDDLSIGYKKVESRMQFGNAGASKIDDSDICQHVIGYDLPEEHQSKVVMYNEVEQRTKDILGPFLNKIDDIINSETKSVGQKFIIMSTNWCGKSRHFKHLHTLLQGDKCNTFSVVLPIYIDPNQLHESHGFYWHHQSELYPRITYTSGDRMEKVDREYVKSAIPKESITSLSFDSSRTIHYIDNTPHLYLWVVCDAVEFMTDRPINGVHFRRH